MSESTHGWRNTLVYTLLRLLLWLALWAILQYLTPVKGLLAVVLSLLLSSAISIIVLDRQRDAMSAAVGGFFSGINARIEHSAMAEDAWEREAATDSAPGEQSADEQAVDEHEHPGLLEGDDQLRSAGPADDEPDRADR